MGSELYIEFINTYIGDHRVCWRIETGDPLEAYDCTTTVTCTTIGTQNTTISITVLDNETCDDITFGGYVQATCQDAASLTGRVYFSETFSPVPVDCVSYLIKCNSSSIENVEIIDGGSGYTTGSPITVTINGGGGTGDDIEGNIGDGGIKTWTITSGGTAYNGSASAVFLDVDTVTLTGTGSGAVFNVTVTSGVITLLELVSTENGSGFVAADTFKFAAADLGGNTGTECTITVDSLNTGEVQSITMVDGGSGFTSIPTVTFEASPGGITATGTPIVADCASFQFVQCDTTTAIKTFLEIGQQALYCDDGAAGGLIDTLPTGYTAVAYGCCYDCKQVRFTPASEVDIYYIDGTTEVITTQTISSQTDISLINNSWFWLPSTTSVTVLEIGDCP